MGYEIDPDDSKIKRRCVDTLFTEIQRCKNGLLPTQGTETRCLLGYPWKRRLNENQSYLANGAFGLATENGEVGWKQSIPTTVGRFQTGSLSGYSTRNCPVWMKTR